MFVTETCGFTLCLNCSQNEEIQKCHRVYMQCGGKLVGGDNAVRLVHILLYLMIAVVRDISTELLFLLL